MESLISRLIVCIMWISLPILLLLNVPIKFIAFMTIIWLFTLYSHICHAIIHRDLIATSRPWFGLLQILMFGPLEIDRLKKLQQISINAE